MYPFLPFLNNIFCFVNRQIIDIVIYFEVKLFNRIPKYYKTNGNTYQVILRKLSESHELKKGVLLNGSP